MKFDKQSEKIRAFKTILLYMFLQRQMTTINASKTNLITENSHYLWNARMISNSS